MKTVNPSAEQPEATQGSGAPERVGEFELQERIGVGGFGAVYRAYQSGLGRHAVVKLPTHKVGAEAKERFVREAQLASRIDHPYAAHIYAFGVEDNGTAWIAMEYVRGTSLADWLNARGPMRPEQFVPLFARVCEVVQHAHDQGIIHCDLKPDNVMVVTRAGKQLPKLLDLGVARVLGDAEPAQQLLDGAARTKHRSGQTGPRTGSPAYMPPEQWVGSHVDHRADIYALGAMAYELLVGQKPFTGATLWQIASAHANATVPALPSHLPSGLHSVIAKAMAKKPAQRFVSAMEFAAALRTACGFGEEHSQLPRLDPHARDSALRMPSPIAQAVAAIESARSPRALQTSLYESTQQVFRWLGNLALAARSRIVETPGFEISNHLRRLRDQPGAISDWVAVLQASLADFVNQEDAFPVPELVGWMQSADIAPHLAYAQWCEEPVRRSETEVLERVQAYAQTWPQLISDLDFLRHYRLITRQSSEVVHWDSVYSVPYLGEQSALAEDATYLLNSDGAAMCVLSPLVMATSAGDGPAALFLFAGGGGQLGGKLIACDGSGVTHRSDVWDWIAKHFLLGQAAQSDSAAEQSPYRGLAGFADYDARWFFGREREVDATLNRLQKSSLVFLTGPSGAGKSSFLAAGLFPAASKAALGNAFRGHDVPLRSITLRPGTQPMLNLGSALRGVGLLTEEGAGLAPDMVRQAAEHYCALGDARLLIVVDQLEELFTHSHSEEERECFAASIAALAVGPTAPIRVVVAMRDDFLAATEGLKAFRGRISSNLQILTTPSVNDLHRIVCEPLRLVDYAFDDPQLPQEMVAAVAGQPGALALLSFACLQLWQKRDKHFRRITRTAYESIGGVLGAVAQHAEQTIASMPSHRMPAVREVFRQLVHADGTRAVVSRKELLSALKHDGEEVLELLIEARLVQSRDGENTDHIEIVHESLVGAWPRLAQWRTDELDTARLHDQLRSAALQWADRGQPTGLLWRGDALAELRLWRVRYSGALTATEESFHRESNRAALRGRRIRRAVAGIAAIAATSVTIGMWSLSQQATSERDKAQAQRALADDAASLASSRFDSLLLEQGRQATVNGETARGLAYLIEARRRGVQSSALDFLIGDARAVLSSEKRVFRDHRETVALLAVSPQLGIIAASSQSPDRSETVLRSAKTGELLTRISHTGKVPMSSVLDDEHRTFAIAMIDSTSGVAVVEEYDLTGRVRSSETLRPGCIPTSIRASAQTAILMQCGQDIVLRLSQGKEQRIYTLAQAENRRVAGGFTNFGVVIADGDSLWLWSETAGAQRVLRGQGRIARIGFSRNGDWVVTWHESQQTLLLDVAQRRAIGLPALGKNISRVAVSSDGRFVAAARGGEDVLIDRSRLDAGPIQMESGLGTLAFAFSTDGQFVLAGGSKGTIGVWDLTRHARYALLPGHTATVHAMAMLDASRFATGGEDRTVRLWQLPASRLVAEHKNTAWMVESAAGRVVSSSESAILQGTSRVELGANQGPFFAVSGDVLVWGAGNDVIAQQPNAAPKRYVGAQDRILFPAISERHVAATSRDGTARVWDRESGELQQTIRLGASLPQGFEASGTFSPDGKTYAVGDPEGRVHVVDLAGRDVRVIAVHDAAIFHVAFSPDGKLLATASRDGTARIISRASEAILVTLQGHTDIVNNVVFHPTQPIVATSSWDGTARIWDAGSGDVLRTFQHSSGVTWTAYSQDGGSLLTSSSAGEVHRFEISFDHSSADEATRWSNCALPWLLEEGKLVANTWSKCE